jgi:hypothetical protein
MARDQRPKTNVRLKERQETCEQRQEKRGEAKELRDRSHWTRDKERECRQGGEMRNP